MTTGDSLAEAIGRLAPELPPFGAGEVWLAGAGPGSLGCLTLEVVAALAEADAVVYDALVAPEVLRAARPGAAMHFVGKRRGQPSTPQAEINALLVRLAGEGRRVLRLKGGDPNIFGRGGEEALALAEAGVVFRVLPGVTSAFGALASARIPATRRGVSKALILATGHGVGTADDLDWGALARAGQPIVIYMGLAVIGEIAAALMAGGLAAGTPAAVIASATTPEERVLVADLGSLAGRVAAEAIRGPALIVVGEIVRLREELVALAAEHVRA
ncbi:MAG TPA: uroporphyrinogen-III C-methyltransferase [Amaricoccus sp.]|nr:uroporphyrinogen-III C-methyltransferase [Amaricoccus sp.]